METVFRQGIKVLKIRSFQYVHDLVDGLIQTMASKYTQPINIGNPDEYKIIDFANLIKSMVKSQSSITFGPATNDDPKQRRPDISRAMKEINWYPKFSIDQGLGETIAYFRQYLSTQQ